MIKEHLQLKPGQTELTPEQQAEAQRFAAERAQVHLSTEPVDEQLVERWVCQAYELAKVPPPTQIQWLDGPLQLVAALASQKIWASVWNRNRLKPRLGDSVWAMWYERVWSHHRWGSLMANLWSSPWTSMEASVRVQPTTSYSLHASVSAYEAAPFLAFCHFTDAYLAPNELEVLAHFIERVSGYWLGEEMAIIVRRPHLLSLDRAGLLHSATGKCLEYRDGWGSYAWHGVRVPERVILAPETLTREDFFQEPNVEVRRVMQERMGERFLRELGGQVIDRGPHGTLYEVRLPEDDPEGVARYVQVQDTSTARQYFLRVPPTMQTAAEAVAWSFQLAAEEYGPAHET